jgi:hypothetical protein
MKVTIPSERKFAIYHAIDTERMSPVMAARRFGITVGEVLDIAANVRHFVAVHGSIELLDQAPEEFELISLRRCHAQLDHFYTTLMHQWRTVEHNPAASARLLHAAARLAIEQTRIAGRIAKVQRTMIEEGILDRQTHEYVYEEEPAETTSPPAGGCTASLADWTDDELRAAVRHITSLNPNATSDDVMTAILTGKYQKPTEKTPAHSDAETADPAAA